MGSSRIVTDQIKVTRNQNNLNVSTVHFLYPLKTENQKYKDGILERLKRDQWHEMDGLQIFPSR